MLFFGFIITFISSNAGAACKLSFIVTNLPSQYYKNEDGTWVGDSVEIIDALLSEINCEPIFKELPWKKAIIELENGRLDIMETCH